jgi:hypothetical protein
MRNILIIFLLSVFWSCTSCNSNDSKTDTDNAIPDKDSVAVIDSETQDEDTESETPDTGTDADSEAECLPPLIEAPFPYYDKDGNITFCRPDCNEATEKDPQCMSNLWKEQNQALCTQMPQYDCCGYPCVMESLKPMNKEEADKELVFEGEILVPMHKCDLIVSPLYWGNDGTMGVVKSWNMSDGKIGFYLSPAKPLIKDWPVKLKYVSYDIETKQYNLIIPARGQEQAYNKGKRIGLTADKRSLDLNNSNIFMAYISDDGKVELIYNKKVKQLSYEPALNDKWAFANISEVGSKKMYYAKVGEWKWTALGEGTLRMSNLSGDRFALFTDDLIGYICDLNKSPQSLNDCYKVNQGEELRYLVLDKENSNRAAYSSALGKIVLMEYKNGKWNYTDIITSYSDEVKDYAIGFIINIFKGKMLLYEEAFKMGQYSEISANKLCYYNMEIKKSYCMKKMDNDKEYNGIPIYPYGDAEFEGKWLLYQKLNSTPLILRDMACYCKEEGVCPFEE